MKIIEWASHHKSDLPEYDENKEVEINKEAGKKKEKQEVEKLAKTKGTEKAKKEEEKTGMKGKEVDETKLNVKIEDGEYKCYKCGVIMRTMKKFTCHIRQKHVEIQRNGLKYKCDVCKKPVTSMKELMYYMEEEHMRFHCDKCETVRESIKELNEHK